MSLVISIETLLLLGLILQMYLDEVVAVCLVVILAQRWEQLRELMSMAVQPS